MPYYLTFEAYLQKPEEPITPPKIQNLMKIIRALGKQADNHPENPYLTALQIREIAGLQNSQLNAAMCQRQMKELFWGKDTAFGLSNVGRQVYDGTREVNLVGISRPGREHIRPLSLYESRNMPEHVKIVTTVVGKLMADIPRNVIKLSLKENDQLTAAEQITILRSTLWEYNQAVNKKVEELNNPPVTRLSDQTVALDNVAKPTIESA